MGLSISLDLHLSVCSCISSHALRTLIFNREILVESFELVFWSEMFQLNHPRSVGPCAHSCLPIDIFPPSLEETHRLKSIFSCNQDLHVPQVQFWVSHRKGFFFTSRNICIFCVGKICEFIDILITSISLFLDVFCVEQAIPYQEKRLTCARLKIPSALKPELSPSSRASSGFVGRGKLG